MLNHQKSRGLLFHNKTGFYFFGKSTKKHPDSLCENNNNINELNVCAYYMLNY